MQLDVRAEAAKALCRGPLAAWLSQVSECFRSSAQPYKHDATWPRCSVGQGLPGFRFRFKSASRSSGLSLEKFGELEEACGSMHVGLRTCHSPADPTLLCHCCQPPPTRERLWSCCLFYAVKDTGFGYVVRCWGCLDIRLSKNCGSFICFRSAKLGSSGPHVQGGHPRVLCG